MFLWGLCFVYFVAKALAQDPLGPAISTANGNLRLKSRGDLIFELGESGQLQFMTASGDQMPLGQKGERGEQGEPGPVGPEGPAAEDKGIIAWNECTWQNLNSGLDYGHIATCRYNKQRNDTWLRVTWNGNMRITRCETCCMRWYLTINGEECADPGPMDAVIFQSRNYHIVRQSTITGSCRATGPLTNSTPLNAGTKRIQFSIQDCPGFAGFVYDAYTGWNSVSRIVIEELLPREDTFPEVAVRPPSEFVFSPHYCQFLYPDLGVNNERNLGAIIEVKFQKDHDHTVLRITWEGNLRKKSCTNCCSRWWINVDGSPCSNYESIETSIASSNAVDIFVPTTLTGVCFESADLPISSGSHQIRLMVSNCPGSPFTNAASGFFSTSRLIVEEIPRPRDPLVNAAVFHPQWVHCTISEIEDGGTDEGVLNDTACVFNKTTSESSLRVSFNGNIRITNCQDCCMRWYLTINGEECTDPAPIDAVIFSSNARTVNVHRGSTIAGICQGTAGGPISTGPVQVLLNVGMCDGFNETYNAFSGFASVSTINVEEMPTPLETAPSDGSFYPNWIQCVTDSPLNSTINDSSVMSCEFSKLQESTVLRVAWDGSIAVLGCDNCCMRWFITIDGEECNDPGPIDIALRQDLTEIDQDDRFDEYRPASVVGFCRGSAASSFSAGTHTISLSVGPCKDSEGLDFSTSDVLTGYNSVSRFIVEEFPEENEQQCSAGRRSP